MGKAGINLMLVLVAVLAFVGLNSLFVINAGNVGIVTRFGKVVRAADDQLKVNDPGLHFKIPFIDQVKTLDARIQTLNSSADRFVTSEKKDLIIDSYVKWKISDPATFYLTTAGGNVLQAEDLLKRRITNSLRSQIGRLTIHELVSGKEGESIDNSFDSDLGAGDAALVSKREEVMQNALKELGTSAKELGISIIDVRMKQINLPPEVSNSIYQRMRAERNAVAKLHRSQGSREAEAIRAQADREVVVKLAEAEREARTLKGEGDAEAIKIYADAYNRNPALFEFLRSMDAYRSSTKEQDVMVLRPENEFLKFFNSPEGGR
ncbi:MAG: protease modulator HflC [Succinivibrionaceae bacterium]|nr:protease modulator HflC [Succinivibrionaceae bacterium]